MVYNCKDKEIIKNIITHPKVLNWVTDDNTPAYEVILHPSLIYIVNEENTGVVRVDPINSICCSIHIAALPELWGKTDLFALDALDWGFKNTLYQKVVGIFPSYNTHVMTLAERMNFKHEGTITKSFMKNWTLHDQKIYTLNKGDFLCQQQ